MSNKRWTPSDLDPPASLWVDATHDPSIINPEGRCPEPVWMDRRATRWQRWKMHCYLVVKWDIEPKWRHRATLWLASMWNTGKVPPYLIMRGK